MVKVALVLAFSIVSAMSIHAAISTDDVPGGASLADDKTTATLGSGDNMAKSPTQQTLDNARMATAPAVYRMRGAAHAIASQASNAAETAKYETDSLGSWLKAKFQGLWGVKNHAPAPAPMA